MVGMSVIRVSIISVISAIISMVGMSVISVIPCAGVSISFGLTFMIYFYFIRCAGIFYHLVRGSSGSIVRISVISPMIWMPVISIPICTGISFGIAFMKLVNII